MTHLRVGTTGHDSNTARYVHVYEINIDGIENIQYVLIYTGIYNVCQFNRAILVYYSTLFCICTCDPSLIMCCNGKYIHIKV